jgi:hypothetical protein
MTQSAPQVFTGITPEQFARLGQKAAASGIALNGNSGSATKFGVKVGWNYSPEEQKLVLECLETPFFMSSDEVNAKLQAMVKMSLSEA